MKERIWNDETISESGCWRDIPLEQYHRKVDLLDGPSISKSSLKWLLPAHGGSPKAFWGRWAYNPARIEQEPSVALDFGKATHCLLLGDEVFDGRFAVRPEEWKDWRTKASNEWREEQIKAGRTIVLPDHLDMIRKMRADAAEYPLVQGGILDGLVERSLFWKDEETGIWLKCRPDVIAADGIYADLKTTASFDEDFLERQNFDAGYYLQGAMLRMVCRALEIPFDTFVLLYVLKDDVPDTTHVELSTYELDRGEMEIRAALRLIRRCLDAGEWPGARPFAGGTRALSLKPWAQQRIDNSLKDMETAA